MKPAATLALLAALIAAATAPAAAQVPRHEGPPPAAKLTELLHDGCRLAPLSDERRCRAAGERAIAAGAPAAEVIRAGCGKLAADKLKLLCAEHMMDHLGPTALDDAWRACHRAGGGIRAVRACLLRRLWPEGAALTPPDSAPGAGGR